MLSVAKQEKFKAFAIMAIMLVWLVIIAVTTTGCRTAKAVCQDFSGIADAAADVLNTQVEKAEERDANRNAKYLMLYNAKNQAQAKLQ